LRFYLAPPLLAKPDPVTGRIAKQSYGPWMMRVFKGLTKLKGLRGSVFDIFGYSRERGMERQLIVDYEADIELILSRLNPESLDTALELAALPEQIRGFGHIKEAAIARIRDKRALLRQQLQKPAPATKTCAAA
jgi:indolepyruvate ferredoxin oxidoreductase